MNTPNLQQNKTKQINTLNQIWFEEEKMKNKNKNTQKTHHHHQNSDHYFIPNASHWA